MKLKQTSARNILLATLMTASFLLALSFDSIVTFAQSGFEGDYDLSFGMNGYTVDGQFPDPSRPEGAETYFVTGDMMSDGSLVAGGGLKGGGGPTDPVWYIKKYLSTGALDTSFNGGKGLLIPDFYVLDTNPRAAGIAATTEAEDLKVRPRESVLAEVKVLPDNKILVVGVCNMSGVAEGGPAPISSPINGKAMCMMRFNPDGTLDTTFGSAGEHFFKSGNAIFKYNEVPGMVLRPIHNTYQYRSFFTMGDIFGIDTAIQPDGKIVIVGYSQTHNAEWETSGFLMRYSSQGAIDTTFGINGVAYFFANPEQDIVCTPRKRLFGVAIQPDGRILAMGSDDHVDTANCTNFHSNRFVVTRWTASGVHETTRYLDNDVTSNYRRERATSAFFTDGGSKVVVSGTYKCKASLIKFNVSDLSLDTTFGTNGIAGYIGGCPGSSQAYGDTLTIKAIQADGKILGVEDANSLPRLTRFNPDGTVDTSFGNESPTGNPGFGSLRLNVLHYNNVTSRGFHNQVIVRPNGRLVLFGFSFAFNPRRAVISQQNTELPTYALAGRVLNGTSGVAGVSVNLTGSQSATTTTDASGSYAFTELAMGGNYTVTPTKAGLSFIPASKSFTNLAVDQLNVDFSVPSLSINNLTVTELNTGEAAATFTVKLSAASTETVTVKYATMNGTALAPADYTAVPLTTLTFTPGQTTQTVSVLVKGDVLDEANESFKVLLSAPTKALISSGEGICTVTDNDLVPTLKVNSMTIVETNATSLATFTISLSAASSQTVKVNYATANGTALAPADYAAKPLTALTFLPGQTSKTVAVSVMGDLLDEPAENFRLLLSSPVNATIAAATGICTITDNDLPPSIRVNNVSVTESNTATVANFTISLSAPSGMTVKVNYATANGTALAPADYTAKALTTLTFLPGQTTKTIPVSITGDLLDEPAENFRLLLSSPMNATIAVGTGTCTITDNDAPPSFTISNATVTEPDSGVVIATLTVKLSAVSGQTISVRYATANGTTAPATAGTDYTAVALTTLTFAPGQVTKTVSVQVKADLIKELNETFFVNLSGPINATMADAQGLGTILNDD